MNDPAVNFWPALWNSIISSGLIAASVVVTSTLAGWAFAKLRFPGSKALLVFVVATMAVPMQLGVVPLYILFDLGWTGQIGAIIVPAVTSAFGVFWMTQYLQQSVPDELIEAARVDGASMIRTFWTVGCRRRLAGRRDARPVHAFVTAWNNFFWPVHRARPQRPTLPVALSLLQSNHFVDYSIVLAGVLLSTIPLLLLFVVAGKQPSQESCKEPSRDDHRPARHHPPPSAASPTGSRSAPPRPRTRSRAPPTRTVAPTRSGTPSAGCPAR